MLSSLRSWLDTRFWFVHPPITLLLNLPKHRVVPLLTEAAKPSKDRLHLQEVFERGRRYQLQGNRKGFHLLSTSKSYWRYTEGIIGVRRRTRAAARLVATVADAGGEMTRLEARAHIRLGYLLDVLWIPLFFTTIVVGVPWTVWGIAGVVLVMFALSYGYHRYQAAYQATEMVYFINKALKDHFVYDLPTLPAMTEDVMYGGESFASEWERFYRARQPKD